jgi:TfoX/Sxy family transcriptional regulator of competence genes
MAYDEQLAARVRKILSRRKGLTEKKMFGGLSFLLDGKMCCGVLRDDLVIRIQPEDYEAVLKESYVRPMDFTGRPLKGFIYVGSEGCQTEQELSRWVEHGVDFVSSISNSKSNRKRGRLKDFSEGTS